MCCLILGVAALMQFLCAKAKGGKWKNIRGRQIIVLFLNYSAPKEQFVHLCKTSLFHVRLDKRCVNVRVNKLKKKAC